MEAHRIALINTPIFKNNFSENIISRIIPLIKELHLNPEEKIIELNCMNDYQIYFIEKGKLELCL